MERDLDAADRGAAAEVERIRIAWEELARDRPPRFVGEQRVLVALEPLPGGSLWRQRFPARDALVVAGASHAFLRDPDATTLDGLARWRALSSEDREAAPGASCLAGIAAHGALPIAEAAARRLAELPGLAARLDPGAADALATAIVDGARSDALRLALVELAGARGLVALRPALMALTGAGPPLAGRAWASIATLDGALPEATVKTLLDAEDPAVRVVAVRLAATTVLESRAATLARRDPAPEVRSEAVSALVAGGGAERLQIGLDALFDVASPVRAAAARAVGARGVEVVPQLRALAEQHAGQEAAGPLAALGYAGPEGLSALRALASTHPDARTRQLARLLAGQELREH